MKSLSLPSAQIGLFISVFTAIGTLTSGRADQLLMANGDRYNGKILSVSSNTVNLQSEILGNVTIPRTKVVSVNFGNAPIATAPAPQSLIISGSPQNAADNSGLSAGLRQLASQTNLIQQVQAQFLAGADPKAMAKFNDLLNGLSTGTISISDLQVEARSAAKQLRDLKKQLGPDADDALDSYLSILDHFVSEAGDGGRSTAKPATSAKSKTDSLDE